jgi:hypothetical protein
VCPHRLGGGGGPLVVQRRREAVERRLWVLGLHVDLTVIVSCTNLKHWKMV